MHSARLYIKRSSVCMYVCFYSHNSSLGGHRQKPIGALNSVWIGEEAKPKIVGPLWAVSGLFGPFRSVHILGRFGHKSV